MIVKVSMSIWSFVIERKFSYIQVYLNLHDWIAFSKQTPRMDAPRAVNLKSWSKYGP